MSKHRWDSIPLEERCPHCLGSGVSGGPMLRWRKACEYCGGSGYKKDIQPKDKE
jgi:DnaJ-class molecular chaperone